MIRPAALGLGCLLLVSSLCWSEEHGDGARSETPAPSSEISAQPSTSELPRPLNLPSPAKTLSKYRQLVEQLKATSASLRSRISELERLSLEQQTISTGLTQSLTDLRLSESSLSARLEAAEKARRLERWRWIGAVLLALLTGGGIGALLL